MNFDLRFFAKVTILVLVDSVLQYKRKSYEFERQIEVTILVLVDSVLQYGIEFISHVWDLSHNPCFSGQCFAILHEF